MNRFLLRLTALTGALLCLALPAWALEPCFSSGDLEALAGICITGVPDPQEGRVLLGDRILEPGDILTADQAGEAVFSPTVRDRSRKVRLSYLPIRADGVQALETAILSIRGRINEAPIAQDSSLETYRDLPGEGRLKVRDPEEEPMTFTLVRAPRRGSVELHADGSFTYTPKKNRVGTDSFVYTAADAAGNRSREATVVLEIRKPTEVPQYVDTLGTDCRFAAEWMKHTGLFVGETLDGKPCFHPDRAVSRGEFLTMLIRSLEIPLETEASMEGVPLWLRPYAAAALRSGLTAGLPQEALEAPDRPISGEEVWVLLKNALDLPASDDPAAAAWAASLPPDQAAPITRAQAAKLFHDLNQALN